MIKLYITAAKKENEHEAAKKLAEIGLLSEFKKRGKLCHDDVGKPFFSDVEGIYVSISHGGGLCVAALSDGEIGVDIEPACGDKKRLEKLARRYFSEDEYKYTLVAPIPRFYEIWCAKESYAKYTGKGLSVGLRNFSVLTGAGISEKVTFSHREYEGCIISICAAEEWRDKPYPIEIK